MAEIKVNLGTPLSGADCVDEGGATLHAPDDQAATGGVSIGKNHLRREKLNSPVQARSISAVRQRDCCYWLSVLSHCRPRHPHVARAIAQSRYRRYAARRGLGQSVHIHAAPLLRVTPCATVSMSMQGQGVVGVAGVVVSVVVSGRYLRAHHPLSPQKRYRNPVRHPLKDLIVKMTPAKFKVAEVRRRNLHPPPASSRGPMFATSRRDRINGP
jgi:hypothetical protein